MFVNQVNIKDLFSTNPGHLITGKQQESGDSCAIDSGSQSNSQLPYSQVDFADSQDCGSSQQFSSGQSQTSESPGKKFYQRYMAKGPLFNRDSSQSKNQSSAVKLSFSEQLKINKVKAKDRDERDLLNSMVLIMKECAAEVKGAVEAVKENLREGISSSESQIAVAVKRIEDELSRQQNDLLGLLEVKKETAEENAKLRQMISERDSRIKELEQENNEMRSQEEHRVLEEVQKLHCVQQQAKEHIANLHQVCSSNQRELQRQTKQQEQQHQEILQTSQHQHQQYQIYIQRMEDRLQAELNNFSKLAHKEQIKLKKEWEAKIHHVQENHKVEFEKLMKRQVKQVQNESLDNQSQVMQQQQQQLLDLQRRHKAELETVVRQQVEYHGHQQKCQLEQMIGNLWQREQQRIKIMEREHHNIIEEENQRKLEKQLNNIRERHQKEVARLKQQQEVPRQSDHHYPLQDESRNTTCEEMSHAGFCGSTPVVADYNKISLNLNKGQEIRNTYPARTEWTSLSPYGRMNVIDPKELNRSIEIKPASKFDNALPRWTKCFGSGSFMSPISTMANTWSSKTLFSKSNPSPIVAVKPQINRSLSNSRSVYAIEKSRPPAVITQEVVSTRITRSKAIEASKPPPLPKKRKRGKGSRFGNKKRNAKKTEGNNQNVIEDFQNSEIDCIEVETLPHNSNTDNQCVNQSLFTDKTSAETRENILNVPPVSTVPITCSVGTGNIDHLRLTPVITPKEIPGRSPIKKTRDMSQELDMAPKVNTDVFDFNDEDNCDDAVVQSTNNTRKISPTYMTYSGINTAQTTDMFTEKQEGRYGSTTFNSSGLQSSSWKHGMKDSPAKFNRCITLFRRDALLDSLMTSKTGQPAVPVSDSDSDSLECSDGSHSSQSSPSLSVTEVFIKRKVKQEKMSPLPLPGTTQTGNQLVW